MLDTLGGFSKVMLVFDRGDNPMHDFRHFMLDIETLGTAPGAYITQIGLVEFHPLRAGEPLHHAQAILDLDVLPGPYQGPVDARTALWWMTQDEDARLRLTSPSSSACSLTKALDRLVAFLPKDNATYRIWARPPAFDLVHLEMAFSRCGMKAPWRYDAGRCVRTICELAGMGKEELHKAAVAHHALSDALAQAADVRAAMQLLGKVPMDAPVRLGGTVPDTTPDTTPDAGGQ